ncbi:MAG: spore germination protein [Oscillospiraceae bacterium]
MCWTADCADNGIPCGNGNPDILSDFFRETDDYYFLPVAASYIRIIRMLVALLNVVITPLLLLVSNSAAVPDWLGVLIPERRERCLYLYSCFLEFAVDGLKRLLNTPDLSNSLGVVGGLCFRNLR